MFVYSFVFTEAFQKARSRMVAARENLKQDYIETIKAYESDDQ